MNLNKVTLAGRITRDIELRYLPSGSAVAAFGLAINRKWKNAQGEQQEEVTFVDLEAFGKPAEVMNQFLRKGSGVFIEGRLKLDQWEDKDGNKRQKMKVVVNEFQFIDGKPAEQGQSQQPAERQGRQPQERKATPPTEQHEEVDENDIPFDYAR
jgi:single-strand DNA-binding protein